jgi:hypothetical protein
MDANSGMYIDRNTTSGLAKDEKRLEKDAIALDGGLCIAKNIRAFTHSPRTDRFKEGAYEHSERSRRWNQARC